MRTVIIKLSLILSLVPAILLGQVSTKTGTTAASFLEIPVGSAAKGMGGAFVSLANDVSALYWNAGGIANLTKTEFLAERTGWIAETNMDFVGLVIPVDEIGVFGVSMTTLSMEDMKVTTVEKQEGTGEYFSAGSMAIGVTFARAVTDRFSIGFTGKYIEEKIYHMSSSGFALDAGTYFRTDLFNGMVIGASFSNFGSQMKLSGRDTRYFIRVDNTKTGTTEQVPVNIDLDSWDLPFTFQIGVSTNIIKNDDYRLTTAIDAIHPNNNSESMNVGTEAVYQESLFIRAGFKSLFMQDREGGLSFGFGLQTKSLFEKMNVKVDYAYRDFGRLGSTNGFSIAVQL